jgi:Tol biopolymer transport system component
MADGASSGWFEFTGGAGGAEYFAANADGAQRRLIYTVPPWVENAQDEAGFSGVSLAPGGTRFVTVDPDQGLEVGTDGDNADQVLPHTVGPDTDITVLPLWGPDGRDLAVATQSSGGNYTDGLYVVRANGSGYRQIMADGLQAGGNSVAWSPDGDEIAIWVQKPPAVDWEPSTLEVVDLLDHTVRKLVTVPASLIPEGVFWAADGRLVLQLADNSAGTGSSGCGCEIRQIPASGGHLTPLTHKVPATDGLVQVSPDGTTIVVETPGRGHPYQYLNLDGSVVAGPARAPAGWVDWVAAEPAPESRFDRGWQTGPPGGTTVPSTAPTTVPRPDYGTDGIIELGYAPPDISPIASRYLAEAPSGAHRALIYTTPSPVLDGEVLDSTDFYGGPALGPGGRAMADLNPATYALEVGPAGGALSPVWPRHGDGTAGWGAVPDWSPDGRDVAVATNGWANGASYADGLDIVRADGSRSKQVLGGGLVDGPAWSPDGDELALWVAKRPGTDNERATLEVVNLVTGTVKELVTIQSYLVPEGMSWNPDGYIYSNIYNSNEPSTGGVVVDRVRATGGALAPWPIWSSLVNNRVSTSLGVVFSPNGAQVLVDRGGSFVILTATRRLYSVASPNASVLEWAPSSPAPQSTFDRDWHQS